MDPENRWVKKAASIPWYDIEIKYAALFPSETGMPAKPLQTALGSLMIQKKYDYSDRELPTTNTLSDFRDILMKRLLRRHFW